MALVIDIGNSWVKWGFFHEERLQSRHAYPCTPFPLQELKALLEEKRPSHILISSVNTPREAEVKALLKEKNLAFKVLDFSRLKMVLDVQEPDQVGHDRIANAYGALKHFPLNDCIIVDIGTAVTCDFITKEGRYTGGMIYPGPKLSAQALAQYTDRLPLVTIARPPSPLGKTTETHIQSGVYYGLLGAIERLIDELKWDMDSPSSIKVLATGGALRGWDDLAHDLAELVDHIDPDLTLIGLYEIQKEGENSYGYT